jgi:hypothetical protein
MLFRLVSILPSPHTLLLDSYLPILLMPFGTNACPIPLSHLLSTNFPRNTFSPTFGHVTSRKCATDTAQRLVPGYAGMRKPSLTGPRHWITLPCLSSLRVSVPSSFPFLATFYETLDTHQHSTPPQQTTCTQRCPPPNRTLSARHLEAEFESRKRIKQADRERDRQTDQPTELRTSSRLLSL